MSDRGWVATPTTYLEMSAISGSLLQNLRLREIVRSAGRDMRLPFAALSLGSTHFSLRLSLYVREALVAPEDFSLCIMTAARVDVFTQPSLDTGMQQKTGTDQLRSYAGCAVPDRDGRCIGVFYVMDRKPRRFCKATLDTLRTYTHLVASQIEILRRFGLSAPEPSPHDIISRAGQIASEGDQQEARRLVALAYAAHDIQDVRRRLAASTPP